MGCVRKGASKCPSAVQTLHRFLPAPPRPSPTLRRELRVLSRPSACHTCIHGQCFQGRLTAAWIPGPLTFSLAV